MDLSEIFNNLSDHETYHRQISGALVKMAETGIKSPEIAKYNFIPTRNKKNHRSQRMEPNWSERLGNGENR